MLSHAKFAGHVANFARLTSSFAACGGARSLHTSSVLCKLPTRRKKTGVSEMLKFREERKLFRLSRELKSSETKNRLLKPIEENQLDVSVAKEFDRRKRPSLELDEAEIERRALLLKEWTRFSHKVHQNEQRQIRLMISSQQRALQAVKLHSVELYKKAIEPMPQLEQTFHGPTETPALDGYFAPDGVYSDANKNWSIDPCPLTDKQRFGFSEVYKFYHSKKAAEQLAQAVTKK